jgi:hypothetical protein
MKDAQFQPAKIGDSFGPTWATWWFHIKCRIPASWSGQTVWFRWDADCEGLIWSKGRMGSKFFQNQISDRWPTDSRTDRWQRMGSTCRLCAYIFIQTGRGDCANILTNSKIIFYFALYSLYIDVLPILVATFIALTICRFLNFTWSWLAMACKLYECYGSIFN